MIHYAKKIFWGIVLIFGCFLVLEIFSEVFFKDYSKEEVIPSAIITYDPILGWSNRPNTLVSSRRTGQWIEYKINSKGLRGKETSYQKPKDVFRIVLLGDSYSLGYGVILEKHFSTLLEKYFKNVEVVNLSVQGFGVDQMYLSLLKEGFRYQPNLVLIYVPGYYGYRHMYTKRFGRLKPKFNSDNGGFKLTNCPVPQYYFPTDNGYVAKIDYWLSHYSRFYRVIRYLVRANSHIYKEYASAAQKEMFQEQDNTIFSEKLNDLGERIIFSASNACRAKGVEFLLVSGVKRLFQASEKHDIHSIYIWPALNNKEFQLPDNLGHLNESANGVLSWIIADYLEKNKLVPRKYWY